MSEKCCSASMEILISLIASALACLVQTSVAMDVAMTKLSGPRQHLAFRPTIFVCYHHIKECLMGMPFEYGAPWLRKSGVTLALK